MAWLGPVGAAEERSRPGAAARSAAGRACLRPAGPSLHARPRTANTAGHPRAARASRQARATPSRSATSIIGAGDDVRGQESSALQCNHEMKEGQDADPTAARTARASSHTTPYRARRGVGGAASGGHRCRRGAQRLGGSDSGAAARSAAGRACLRPERPSLRVRPETRAPQGTLASARAASQAARRGPTHPAPCPRHSMQPAMQTRRRIARS